MEYVFKFGGSIIKDASTIKLIASKILSTKNLRFVVLSATYNTTNRLEEVFNFIVSNNTDAGFMAIEKLEQEHLDLCDELELENCELVSQIFEMAKESCARLLELNTSKEVILDELYSVGERASSLILYLYLRKVLKDSQRTEFKVDYIDIRDFLLTDSHYQNASPMLWQTRDALRNLDPNITYISQGFIGRDKIGYTTTLGREGSDYTGAIVSWCLDVDCFVIWKDVEGIFSADPNTFSNAKIIKSLSYQDAKTITSNGAKVVFSRTMEPLETKNIKLNVRSLFHEDSGTIIGQEDGRFFNLSVIKDADMDLLSLNASVDFLEQMRSKIIAQVIAKYGQIVIREGCRYITFQIDSSDSHDLLHLIHELSDKSAHI